MPRARWLPPPSRRYSARDARAFAHLAAVVDFTRAAALQPHTKLIIAPFSHWDFVSVSGWQMITHSTLECVRGHMAASRSPPGAPPYPVEEASTSARRVHPPWDWLTPGRDDADLALPVQLCFLGSLRWRGFRVWPPPPARLASFWLTPGATLAAEPPQPSSTPSGAAEGDAPPTTCRPTSLLEYTYDPAAPTPTSGGPSFNPFNAGRWSQRCLETRSDVLVFTSAPLSTSLSLAGAAKLQVRVWASSRSIDIVGRLCRVDALGLSTNLCEGLTRVDAATDEPSVGAAPAPRVPVRPQAQRMQSWKARALDAFGEHTLATADEAVDEGGGIGRLVTVAMSPLAVDLAPGESLRLHVCSAAHPRWMRNVLAAPETPLHAQVPLQGADATAVVQLAVDDCESYLTLPVIE